MNIYVRNVRERCIKRFSGSVIIKDPLPYPDYIAWEKGLLSEDEKAEKTQGEINDWP